MWTETEVEFLQSNHKHKNWKELSVALQKPEHVIRYKAKCMNLKNVKRDSAIELLSDSLQTFYWIGFLLADGHFHKNKKDIFLSLNVQDIQHLFKFRNLFKKQPSVFYRKHKGFKATDSETARVILHDKETTTALFEKFDLNSQKTYNPPNMSAYAFSNEQLKALIIGFIDGDGSIQRQKFSTTISISVHTNWTKNLEFMNSFLHNEYNLNCRNKIYQRIDNGRMATLSISRREIVHGLRDFIKQHHLPVLERKWSRVDYSMNV